MLPNWTTDIFGTGIASVPNFVNDIEYDDGLDMVLITGSFVDFLNFVARIKLVSKKDLSQFVTEALEMVELQDVKNRLIENLSKGFKQRLGLASALVANHW